MGGLVNRIELVVTECVEFRNQYSRLYCVKTGVVANRAVVVLVLGRPALCTYRAEQGVKLIVIGKYRTAVTVAAERLCREK